MSRRVYIVTACALALATATGVAAGSARKAASADAVFTSGIIKARHPATKVKCGKYTVVRGTFAGALASPDPRLAGTIVFRGKIVVARDGTGFATGPFTIRDQKQRLLMKTTLRALVVSGASLRGMLLGKVYGPNASFLANTTISFDPQFTLAGVRVGLGLVENAAVTYAPLPKKCR
jgi:hypothetical protein